MSSLTITHSVAITTSFERTKSIQKIDSFLVQNSSIHPTLMSSYSAEFQNPHTSLPLLILSAKNILLFILNEKWMDLAKDFCSCLEGPFYALHCYYIDALINDHQLEEALATLKDLKDDKYKNKCTAYETLALAYIKEANLIKAKECLSYITSLDIRIQVEAAIESALDQTNVCQKLLRLAKLIFDL